ncbi:O-antigen ligase family protein [Pusillimonas noertemannii]|uniref:O-antigen ligase family protein n=1 Tax=Pusillimonas noertemannii TaxID=305977 RepID=UPI0014041282|nr:O-antigen ligase family protein [Pusillimonas noertemannii]NYT67176.1 O-antigen ligase family protein [Pusillimonas noertemannii]
MLTSYSLPSGVFYGLIAASLILLSRHGFAEAWRRTQAYRGLIVSYSVLFLAVASSSLYYGEWAGANSEGALRFFLGLWVLLLALGHIERLSLRQAAWGVYIASFVSSGILLWLTLNVHARPVTPGLILTTYTSIMLLLGAISLYSIQWRLTHYIKLETSIKVLAALAAFGGFFTAQTRTGLLGLPIFTVLAMLLFSGMRRPARSVAWFTLAAAVFVVATLTNGALMERITQGIEEVQACHDENKIEYNSMCIRLQLWRSAIDAGASKPWVGLGDGGKFIDYLQDVAIPKGLTGQHVVDEYFGEPHSDLMLMFAGFGFPGLLGLLLIYAAPCTYFLPRLFKTEASFQSKAAAAMGLAVCLGFLFFGLTETMFRRMNTIGFYTAMIAWLMVLSEPRKVD